MRSPINTVLRNFVKIQSSRQCAKRKGTQSSIDQHLGQLILLRTLRCVFDTQLGQ